MAFTRDVNLKFNSATKIINEKPQVDKEDATFQKDVAVTGDLAVTSNVMVAGDAAIVGTLITGSHVSPSTLTWKAGDVDTVDATADVVLAGAVQEVSEGHIATVSGIVHGVLVDGKTFSGRISGIANRLVGGDITLIGTPVWNVFSNTTGGAPVVTLVVNVVAEELRVAVTGIGATNISWHGALEVLYTVL